MQDKVRRHDIDWLRVIVFDILMFYHVGMLFVEWGFHLKNNEIVEWIKYPMLFVNQWRLPILFVISGIGTRFAFSQRSGPKYIIERLKRLGIPLLIGILLVVPPQVYLERLTQGQAFSYWEFYPTIFEGIYPEGNLSWHHLWFLPYLLVMSIVATPLFILLRRPKNKLIELIKKTITRYPLSIALFSIPLIIIEFILHDKYPSNYSLIGDWYMLAINFSYFIFGFTLVSLGSIFWESTSKLKYIFLILGALCFSIFLWLDLHPGLVIFMPILKSLNAWFWILTVLGFAATNLNKDSKILRYRNEAVYPFYILHQTVMMFFAYFLINQDFHYGIKMIILIFCTFFFTWFIYHMIIKKVKFIRPLFGLK